jgi:hypothetical protein
MPCHGRKPDAHAASTGRMSHRPVAIAAAGVLVIVLSVSLLPGLPAPTAAAEAPDRSTQARFMWAMAGQESGWDYYARNAWSGAFGKYQIMPFNWPAWAKTYLGDARADQTPYNQERVAFGKIRDLYRWLGSWKRVAYWWLTGSSESNARRWSAYARGYVRNIMQLRRRAPRDGGRMPVWTSSKADRGDWRRSATRQRLRVAPGARAWSRRGSITDGEVVRVRRSATIGKGSRWLRVVTADGRLGWLPQVATLPMDRPARAKHWRDVDDRGPGRERQDRRDARPRPR